VTTPSIIVRRAATADQTTLARLLSDATNERAQRLYDQVAVPRHDKPFYRLSGDDLRKFAAG